MNKNYCVSLLVVSGFLVAASALAQNKAVLPSAGLTPESSLYFLDRWSEAVQRFFTFNPESRARLEITFAKERIAEIKLILEVKGVNAKGLSIAEAGLQDNLSRATTILAQEKQTGKDTSGLAKDLSDEINPAQDALKDTFRSEKNTLEGRENDSKAKIKEARRAGDTAQVETLTKQLADIKAQKELLEQHGDKDDGDIEEENEHIDEALGLKEEAAEKIREAEKDKAEILKEAKEKNIDVPAETFNAFDSLISQAKSVFDSGSYEEAKRLAKEAKKNLKTAEKNLEALYDAEEKKDELKQEAEEQQQESKKKLKEADKEKAKQIKEEMKQKNEQLREERGKEENNEESRDKNIVVITNEKGFNPSEIKIKKGGKVTWVNKSQNPVWPASNPHPIHTDYPGFDASRGLAAGESYSFTFEKVGSWGYHNHMNPGMSGEVKVVE